MKPRGVRISGDGTLVALDSIESVAEERKMIYPRGDEVAGWSQGAVSAIAACMVKEVSIEEDITSNWQHRIDEQERVRINVNF